jgi:hypothetical protein
MVSFQPSLPFDKLIINGHEIIGKGLERVSYILDLFYEKAGIKMNIEVMRESNLPAGDLAPLYIPIVYTPALADTLETVKSPVPVPLLW